MSPVDWQEMECNPAVFCQYSSWAFCPLLLQPVKRGNINTFLGEKPWRKTSAYARLKSCRKCSLWSLRKPHQSRDEIGQQCIGFGKVSIVVFSPGAWKKLTSSFLSMKPLSPCTLPPTLACTCDTFPHHPLSHSDPHLWDTLFYPPKLKAIFPPPHPYHSLHPLSRGGGKQQWVFGSGWNSKLQGTDWIC